MEVEVLHVWEYGGGEGWEPVGEELTAMAAADLRPKEVHVRRGVPWVELVRYAKERKARMIVAGRHGRSGFQPSALGSTAQRLATSSRVPVLLVSGTVARRAASVREEISGRIDEIESNGAPTPSEAS